MRDKSCGGRSEGRRARAGGGEGDAWSGTQTRGRVSGEVEGIRRLWERFGLRVNGRAEAEEEERGPRILLNKHLLLDKPHDYTNVYNYTIM